MHGSRFHSLICVWAAATTASGGCRTPAPAPARRLPAPIAITTPPAPAPGSRARATVTIETPDEDRGVLTARVPDARIASTDAKVTDLGATETQALLARLEPLPDLTAANASAPAMRAPSLPPPRSGPVQPIAFVVPVGRPVADGPLTPPPPKPAAPIAPLAPPQILPAGEVPAEAEIRVRFTEPMIPVGFVGTFPAPPITITPAIAGRWTWIDTHVAAFTAKAPRLPQATTFTVRVLAGATSVRGATLAADVTEQFSTPPPKIRGRYPETVRPDSPIAIEFDQAIDPAAILPFLRVETARGRPLAFRVIALEAARALWATNPSLGVTPGTAAQLGTHHVIIAPKTRWPAGSDAQMVLRTGAPSAEGSRVVTEPSFASFTVVPAFTVAGLSCDDRPARLVTTCSAEGWMSVELSTPIDTTTFRADKFQIDGLPFDDHAPSGSSVWMMTPETAGKRFTMHVGDGLVDVYGQPLTGGRTIAFTTSRERFSPTLSAPGGLQILDPRFEIPQWVLSAQAVSSLRVELYQVTPADYFAFEAYERGERKTPPGRRIIDKDYPVGPHHSVNLRLDLRPGLNTAGLGHVIAVATATPTSGTRVGHVDRRTVAWIQVTKLGMTARLDGDKVSAWVQDISPAATFLAPLAGVATSLLVEGRPAVSPTVASDAEGHVGFELPARPAKPLGDVPVAARRRRAPDALLTAQTATDSVFTAISTYEKAIRTERARWYVTDDRFLYKPGEKVYLKGWVRWTHSGINPDLALPAAADTITYRLDDARGNKVASGTAPLSDQGGFDLEVPLPANVNLGTAQFTLSTRAQTISHPIKIEEFRTPAFSVSLDEDVTHRGATPLILGESIEMSAEAKYYAGGGLPGARVHWTGSLSAASYQPPGWDGFTFTPVRTRDELDRGWWDHGSPGQVARHGSLSGASTSGVVFGIAALPSNRPSVLEVEATVTDVDRMTIRASSRAILVHPSSYYVGIRAQPRSAGVLEAIVTDIDGNVVRGVSITLDIAGVLSSERYRSDATIVDQQTCRMTSGESAVACPWRPGNPDIVYTAIARIADARGRTNAAQYQAPWLGRDDTVDLAIAPDRTSYRPGEIAKLELRSSVVPATAIVSFARQGVIAQKRVALTTASTIVELPIEASFLQNVHVVVDRTARRQHVQKGSPLPLPEVISTEIELPVDVESARLVMRTRSTQPLVEPGANATFEVEVRHDDKPVANAEVAMIVVDEAVLALANRSHEDPLAPFYREVAAGADRATTLPLIQDLGNEVAGAPGFVRHDLLNGGRSYAVGQGRGGMRGRTAAVPSVMMGSPSVIASRKDFRANAVFSPRLHTNADGKVSLTVRMPDNLTRFRVIALATAHTGWFGKAERTIVTQRRVNARTVPPRFLTQGDTFSLPVVVQNLDAQERTIDVAVRAANLTSSGPAGKRVVVPAGQRAEVRFELSTKARGKAVIQTVATSGDFADASNLEIPIYEPATTESFATYGTVDDAPKFEQLVVPKDIFPDVGGVEIEVASTQLQSLTDAYWYLYAYPYECAEQRSARMLATAALSDILDAFATPERPTRAQIAATIATDVRLLTKQQQRDGGWGYFGNMDADPYVSMQVLSALAAHKITGPVLEKAIGYVTAQAAQRLARLEASVATPAARRADRDQLPYEVSLTASALTALGATGADVRTRVERLHAAATALAAYPIDAKARVLSLVATQDRAKPIRARLLADLLAVTHETASAATVTTSYVEAERLLLVSSTKTSALALDALIREAPEHPLITKLARGVLDARSNGRWASTQENLAVLQTMRRYFDTYEKATPSYTGKLWFGKAAYAEQAFAGRSTARGQLGVDWFALPAGSTHDLTLAKDGPGRMYYRLGITYALKRLDLAALDAGFLVRRTYTAVDDAADVTKLPDGRLRIRLGARILVSIEALATSRRFAVAVVDPLPAGFETVNENLATAERAIVVEDDTRWDYHNMRDNRSEAFVMGFAEGLHRFSYTVRATTPGSFLAAPARAEEMYSPETFGRSTGTAIVIE